MANKEIKDFLFLHQYMPKMAIGNKVYKTSAIRFIRL